MAKPAGKGHEIIIAVLLVATCLAVSLAGCGGGNASGQSQDPASEKARLPFERTAEDADGGPPSGGGAGVVHMCGRSVLGGWFEHWGWDHEAENPVYFDSHRLLYHEMAGPPDIVESAREVAGAAARNGDGTMFFKLCFVDFTGGDEYAARDNLDSNRAMVRQIVRDAVEEGGLTLIIGNALPMVREYSDEWLTWNHREYNRFLDGLAGDYGGKVVIMDLYGTLADPGGWLRPEYALDPYDSHLNDAAYRALDGKLREVLGG